MDFVGNSATLHVSLTDIGGQNHLAVQIRLSVAETDKHNLVKSMSLIKFGEHPTKEQWQWQIFASQKDIPAVDGNKPQTLEKKTNTPYLNGGLNNICINNQGKQW